jgi:hypothetical protein
MGKTELVGLKGKKLLTLRVFPLRFCSLLRRPRAFGFVRALKMKVQLQLCAEAARYYGVDQWPTYVKIARLVNATKVQNIAPRKNCASFAGKLQVRTANAVAASAKFQDLGIF